MPSSWLQWLQLKCSGCHVRPRAVITCPTIGLLQAAQTPFCVVLMPCLCISSCKLPSMSSKVGGPLITGSSTVLSAILKLLSEVISSSSSCVALDALVLSTWATLLTSFCSLKYLTAGGGAGSSPSLFSQIPKPMYSHFDSRFDPFSV